MCGMQLLKGRIRANDLMLMLRLTETIGLSIMAHIVYWYGHVLRREDGHVLRRALDFVVEDQKKKWR